MQETATYVKVLTISCPALHDMPTFIRESEWLKGWKQRFIDTDTVKTINIVLPNLELVTGLFLTVVFNCKTKEACDQLFMEGTVTEALIKELREEMHTDTAMLHLCVSGVELLP